MRFKVQCFLLIVFSFWPFRVQADFSDLSSTDPYYVAIDALVDQGVLTGYEDNTFHPGEEVNRAEALKIVLLGTGVDLEEGTSSVDLTFSDVKEIDWFFPYVSTGLHLGIIKGYEDATFRPEQSVNRAEAMKMLLEAAGIGLEGSVNVTTPTAAPFVDVAVEFWYASYASYAKSWNIEPPQTDGQWHPEEAITRGNLAEMVYRLQKVNSEKHAFDESQNWLRVDFPTVEVSLKVPFTWGYKDEGVGAAFLLDRAHGQLSLLSPYENGATLLLTRYANAEGEEVEDLFDNVIAHSTGTPQETTLAGLDALVIYPAEDSVTYREWYISLPNDRLLHAVALRGQGDYSFYLDLYFDLMMESLVYASASTSDLSLEEILTEIREAIQVDNVGAEMMEHLSDWELLETDSIGVGTGPVDYYYSPSAAITIKYERSFDVILDLREGETTAF